MTLIVWARWAYVIAVNTKKNHVWLWIKIGYPNLWNAYVTYVVLKVPGLGPLRLKVWSISSHITSIRSSGNQPPIFCAQLPSAAVVAGWRNSRRSSENLWKFHEGCNHSAAKQPREHFARLQKGVCDAYLAAEQFEYIVERSAEHARTVQQAVKSTANLCVLFFAVGITNTWSHAQQHMILKESCQILKTRNFKPSLGFKCKPVESTSMFSTSTSSKRKRESSMGGQTCKGEMNEKAGLCVLQVGKSPNPNGCVILQPIYPCTDNCSDATSRMLQCS